MKIFAKIIFVLFIFLFAPAAFAENSCEHSAEDSTIELLCELSQVDEQISVETVDEIKGRLSELDSGSTNLSEAEIEDIRKDAATTFYEFGFYQAALDLTLANIDTLYETSEIFVIELGRQLQFAMLCAEKLNDAAGAVGFGKEALSYWEPVFGGSHPRIQTLKDEVARLSIDAGLITTAPSGTGGAVLAPPPPPPASPPPPPASAPPPPPPPSSSPPPPPAPALAPPSTSAVIDQAFDIVSVFFGTNRAPNEKANSDDPDTFFGGKRAPLTTGIVNVSVPRNRKFASIPKPSKWRGEFRPDPAKHLFLRDLEISADLEAFTDKLADQISKSERKEAVVLIHGYNVTFASAAERAAQLATDLEIDGAPILYSWPSKGSTFGYLADRAQIVRPVIDDLELFLNIIASKSGAEKVNVVAHSMGNEFLLGALEEMVKQERDGPVFDHVVFAAPDVDAGHFKSVVQEIAPLAKSMTLYSSSKDSALKWSKRFQGGYLRAGDSDQMLVTPLLTSIDTTPVSDSSLGHGDIFGPALNDFQAVVWHSLVPEKRCILKKETLQSGDYWKVVPDPSCNKEAFSFALTAGRRYGLDDVSDRIGGSDIGPEALEIAATWVE